jgi:hypothetical protein
MLIKFISNYFFISIIVFGLASAGYVFVIRKLIDQDKLRQANDVTSSIYNMVGLLLAMMLGLMIMQAYSDYSQSNSETHSEATKLLQIWRLADLFDEPVRSDLRNAITRYMDSIHDQEWVSMALSDKGHLETNAANEFLWNLIRQIELASGREITAYREIIHLLGGAAAMRTERLQSINQRIPNPLWYLFVGVSCVSVTFIGFFGTTNSSLHMVLAVLVTGVLVSSMYMIDILDQPYSGPLKITPEMFDTRNLN